MPHWRTMLSSDKLHAADLMGREVVVTIEKVVQGEYPDLEDSKKKIYKPDVYFRGKKKPLGLNSTNARAITKLLGSPNTEKWVGKSIILYPTTTRAFGEEHECIRIRNRLPSEQQERAAASAPPPKDEPAPSSSTSTSTGPIDEEEARLIAEQEAKEKSR